MRPLHISFEKSSTIFNTLLCVYCYSYSHIAIHASTGPRTICRPLQVYSQLYCMQGLCIMGKAWRCNAGSPGAAGSSQLRGRSKGSGSSVMDQARRPVLQRPLQVEDSIQFLHQRIQECNACLPYTGGAPLYMTVGHSEHDSWVCAQ